MGSSRVRRRSRGHHGPPSHPPWRRSSTEGSNSRNTQPPQTLPLSRPFLPLPPDGHLLEVRDQTFLRITGFLHPNRTPAPPEIHHEVAAQRPPHRLCTHLLLAPLLRHPFGYSDRAVESEDREVEES
ncbi:hypothetical protein LOK49_LG03G01009 [Camellia lanceoleosa]|uniref:Uncharacterized protein n=1 Tax=Camellia lanceoleosa TaxID=1840588 RepID=A0ACC0I9U4_9ERIC|nr:hypothetical protein LOK49_LG03G01009 [Camellia lanceoleosa]